MRVVWSAFIWLFYLLPDFSGLFLAAASVALLFMPELMKKLDGRTALRRVLVIALMVIGIDAVLSNRVQLSQEKSSTAVTQQQLQSKVDTLNQNLQKEELQHTSDVRYMEGQLNVFSQFAPAIMRLAQASEENTRKQYEQKTFSNKELRDFVTTVVKKMRDWQYRLNKEEEDAMNKNMAATSPIYSAHRDDGLMKSPQVQQQLSQLFTENSATEREIDAKFNSEFEQNILGDAVSARTQLLSKLGASAEPQFGVFNRNGLYVFQGSLVGPYPVAAAADYLEQFAKKLSP